MTNKAKLKLVLILSFVVTILLIAAFAIIYLNASATLHDGLTRSLETFQLHSVSIADETMIPPSIDLNVSFILRNLADFSITVESINVVMYINNKTIGTATNPSMGLAFTLSPQERVTLYSIRHIDNNEIIQDVKNPPYLLSANATVKMYAQYFLMTETDTRLANLSQIVST